MAKGDNTNSNDIIGKDEGTTSVVPSDDKVEAKKVVKRTRKGAKKDGYKIFKNLHDRDITIFNHTIPHKGEKKFITHIGLTMAKTPIVENLIRLKRIKIV